MRRANHRGVSVPFESWQAFIKAGPPAELREVSLQPGVAEVSALRRRWPEAVVSAAIEAARARKRAAGKLHPQLIERLVADEQGVMVASSTLAGTHKAARFSRAGHRVAFDLCCGIGADAFELVRAGLEVTAVDLDPSRALMARHNVRCDVAISNCDSEDWSAHVQGHLVHLDPSRRDGGRRLHRYEDYRPGPEAIARLIHAAGGACVKLGPGVRFSDLPSSADAYVELLSEHGRLTQALLWTGSLARIALIPSGHRAATRLPGGACFHAEPGPLIEPDRWYEGDGPKRPILDYVYDADPSLERGELLGPFAERAELRPVHPAVGVLTGDTKVDSQWLTRYEVIASMPWRRKAVKAELRTLDAGLVTVKTRGKAVDTDAMQRELRGPGVAALTVFVLRLGDKLTAIITRRHEPAD